MVTPEAPVNVVRKAQMRTLMIVAPPGSQPSTDRKRRTSLSPALLSEMMKPAEREKRNRGDQRSREHHVAFVGDRLQRPAGVEEEQDRQPAKQDEDGASENCRGNEHQEKRKEKRSEDRGDCRLRRRERLPDCPGRGKQACKRPEGERQAGQNAGRGNPSHGRDVKRSFGWSARP